MNNNSKKKIRNYQTILYSSVIILNIIFISLLINNLRLRKKIEPSNNLPKDRRPVKHVSNILKYGDKVPQFQATDLQGNRYHLNSNSKKILLIQFFDIQNVEFVKEILSYENLLWSKYKNKDFLIFGVSKGNINETQYLTADEELTFPIVSDTNFVLHKLFGVHENEHALFLIHKSGVISYSCTCGLGNDNLRQLIENHVLGYDNVVPENRDMNKMIVESLKKVELIDVREKSRHNFNELSKNNILVTFIGSTCNIENIKKRVQTLKRISKDARFDSVQVVCVVTNPVYQSYLPKFLKKCSFPIFYTQQFNFDSYWTRNIYPNPFSLFIRTGFDVTFIEETTHSGDELIKKLNQLLYEAYTLKI